MMRVVIIDYGSGNLHSVIQAFRRAAHERGVRAEIVLAREAQDLASADRLVLPGVGAYADCRKGLDAHTGMVEALEREVLRKGKPFLGICVGMQLLSAHGFEKGKTAGLHWIDGDVVAIKPASPQLKIPQIGWNELKIFQSHPLFEGIKSGVDHAYFVHSYHFACRAEKNILATTDYGGNIVAAIGRDNIVGTQFHPEKSQRLGLQLIANFLEWQP